MRRVHVLLILTCSRLRRRKCLTLNIYAGASEVATQAKPLCERPRSHAHTQLACSHVCRHHIASTLLCHKVPPVEVMNVCENVQQPFVSESLIPEKAKGGALTHTRMQMSE